MSDKQLIIDECKKQGLLRNQAAYVLATVYHETAHTFEPVREYGGETYLKSKRYYPYVGMGYVQLTWRENYQKASDRLGVDFIKNPKLLLKPEYAKVILVTGMKEGWFTTKKLYDYITLQKSDFIGARYIVNGKDKAELIAGYAKQYDKELLAMGYGVETKPKPTPVVTLTFWQKIANLFKGNKVATLKTTIREGVADVLKKEVADPNTSLENKDLPSVTEAVTNEVTSIVKHATNTETHWYQKRSFWSTIVSIGGVILTPIAARYGLEGVMSPENLETTVDVLIKGSGALAGYLAFRAGTATKPLGE